MGKNVRGFFHFLIIAFFSFFLLSGCGHKADPFWVDSQTPKSENKKAVGSVPPNKENEDTQKGK